MLTVSLIATILNEAQTVPQLINSLHAQTRPPDEIVLVDGGSTDGTFQILEKYAETLPIKLILEPGCNISQGRNRAIGAASGDIIVATDAGVNIPPDWIERLIVPLEANDALPGVAGFFLPNPDPHKPFEVAMSATVLPSLADINPETFLPSSRSVAFRKSAWQAVGGYPEWLDYCEDLIFDLRLIRLAGKFAFAPEAYVYFKPRTTLQAFFVQYYRYARGDGKADLWRKRHAIRYVTYLGLVPGVAWLSRLIHPLLSLAYVLGGALYMRRAFQRLPAHWHQLSSSGKLQALLWIPIIKVVGDLAKMIGYLVGWRWRLQENPPDWRP